MRQDLLEFPCRSRVFYKVEEMAFAGAVRRSEAGRQGHTQEGHVFGNGAFVAPGRAYFIAFEKLGLLPQVVDVPVFFLSQPLFLYF